MPDVATGTLPKDQVFTMSNTTTPSQQQELLLQIGAAHDQSDLSSSDDSTQALNAELDSIIHDHDSESNELHSHRPKEDCYQQGTLGNGHGSAFRKQGEYGEEAPALLGLEEAIYGASAMAAVYHSAATREQGKDADGTDEGSGNPSVGGCSTKAVQGDN
jgi:hypothetical protein